VVKVEGVEEVKKAVPKHQAHISVRKLVILDDNQYEIHSLTLENRSEVYTHLNSKSTFLPVCSPKITRKNDLSDNY